MFRALLARLTTLGTHGLPSQCDVCHAWPRTSLCEDCRARFAQPVPRCRTCALPMPPDVPQCGECIRHPPPLASCLTAVDYAYPWDERIVRFKFADHVGAAATLADLMRSAPNAAQALFDADMVLPVPLSNERLRERGYNQALLLARQLAPHKTDANLLLRVRHTLPQQRLSRVERLRNLRGAFLVEPLRAHEVPGRKLLLIDDVMTTGASLHTAALVLLQAGAAEVSALVLARTPPD